MTGGTGTDTSVELLLDDGTPWCSLPDLPEDRRGHSQSGLVACGGDVTSVRTSCVTFSDGVWASSHSLASDRFYHNSWTSAEHGTVLIGGGGQDSWGNTEMLTDDGNSQQSFPLKYNA